MSLLFKRHMTSNGTLVSVDPWVYLALVVGGGHLLSRLREAPPEVAYAYRV